MSIIKKYYLLAPVFFLCYASHSHSFDLAFTKDIEKSWQAGVRGRTMETETPASESNAVGLFGNAKAKYAINKRLQSNAKISALFEAGSTEGLSTDEFRINRALYLRDFNLTWNLFSFASVKGGIIEQTVNSTPLLIAEDNVFPALIESLWHSWKDWHFHLDFLQAIATKQTLSTRDLGNDRTPLTYTQTLTAKHDFMEKLNFAARLQHYSFVNLTHGNAQDSRSYGNNIVGLHERALFVNNFYGLEGGIQVTYKPWADWHFHLNNSFIVNSGTSSKGQYWSVIADYKYDQYIISPQLEYYYNQDDTSVAFYTSKEFGHNNRSGFGFGLKVNLLKQNLVAGFRWISSELIHANSFQGDPFRYGELTLSTTYFKF